MSVITLKDAAPYMEGYLNAFPCADADADRNMLLKMEYFMDKGSANNAASEESPPGSPLFLEDVLMKDSPVWSSRPRSRPAKTGSDVSSLRDCPVAPSDIRDDASPEERLFEYFTPATHLKDVATCPHAESASQEQLPKDEDKIDVMIDSLTTARLSDILPLPEPIPDWRKVRFHGFPVNYPDMNCRMYTEGRGAALKSINAHESLVEFLRTSFASASATFAGVPAHARAPAPDPEAYRQQAPQIVDLDDRDAFHEFSSALLTGWLLHLTEIGFVDPVVGADPGYTPNWEQLSSLAPEIPLQYGMLEGSPDDYVYDTFDRLSSQMYDALSTHFSGWSGWTMFDRLWNVCEPDPVVFTYNSLPYNNGFYSCSLTGRMIPGDPTTRDQVLYVYIPEDVGMDDDGNEVRAHDGIYTICLDGYGHSGYGGAKEKLNIFKYVQAVYDLGHMSAGSVSRFHEVFMKRYFPQGVTEDHDMGTRMKAIDDAVGSCWGLTENYDGIKVIFDLFSRYVRAAWLVDHVMSAHNPTVKDGHWYYNIARVTSFPKDSEEIPPVERPLGRDESRVAIYPPKEDRVPVPKKEEEEEEDDQYTYVDDLFGSGDSSSDTPIQVVSLPPKQNGERPSVYALAHLFVNIRRDVQAVRALLPAHPSFMDGVIGDMEIMTDTIGPSLADAIRGMDPAYGDIYKAGTAATRTMMNI